MVSDLSTAVAGAGVVERYLVQIIVESAFSKSKSLREDFCRSRLEKYSISTDDIWLDVVEMSSSCLVVPMFLPQLVDISVNSTVHFLQFNANVDVDVLSFTAHVGFVASDADVTWYPDDSDLTVDAVQ